MTIHSILGKRIVFSGGGFFRFFPYIFIKHWALKKDYLMTYFHPRDFDPQQPIIPNLSYYRNFKSYVGLRSCEEKLRKILNEFEKYCENLDSELDYELPGERDLAKMKDNLGINESGFNIARNNNFLLSWYVKGMNKYFEKQKKKQFKDSENIVWIKNGLEREFSRIIVNERARIGAALNVDSEYKEAVNILSEYDKYYSILVQIEPENSDYLYRLGGTQAAYSEIANKFKVLSIKSISSFIYNCTHCIMLLIAKVIFKTIRKYIFFYFIFF